MRTLLVCLFLPCAACTPSVNLETVAIANTPVVSGTAANAKGGAVLKADDGRIVYVIGLDSWPEELLDKRVSATGRLEQRKQIPDPVVAEDGAISQGAVGEQWVLEDAEWARAK